MLIYTDLAEKIVRDVVTRVPDFAHVDPDRVLIAASARCTGRHTGNLASCCGLRTVDKPAFSIWTRRGTRQVIAVSQWFQSVTPKVRINGRGMLYLIQLRIPRMLLTNPLETLIHELYHIGEKFDGAMRPVRHGAYFDSEVRRLMRQWLAVARPELARQAQLTFPQLLREHRTILGVSLPANFKIPYSESIRAPESYAAGLARLYPGYRLVSGCEIRRIDFKSGNPMPSLTERDLVLRHFDQTGARRMPQMYTRYARGREATAA